MYNDGEYLQNILLKKSKPNTNNNNLHVMACHKKFTTHDPQNYIII